MSGLLLAAMVEVSLPSEALTKVLHLVAPFFHGAGVSF